MAACKWVSVGKKGKRCKCDGRFAKSVKCK